MAEDIVGASGGKGGGGGHTPIEASDTLESRQTARLLLAVNDGEIDGIDEIYLNRTPISNFVGATWDWRPGTVDQAIIPGFSETENPASGFAAAQITTVNSYVHSIAYDVSAVRVTLSVASLREILGNGDIVGYSVSLSIFTKNTAGSVLSHFHTTVKTGKASNPTSWDIRVPRPAGAVPGQSWEIRIVRNTADDADVKHNSQTSIVGLTEIQEASPALTYPGTALIGLTLRNAEQFGGRVPEVTFRIRGRKIYLPANYNPSTRVYDETPAWSGAFKIYREFTTNPVWHLYNILVEKIGIASPDIDIAAFYAEAKYADQLVPDGNEGMEPRFTINNQFYQRENSPTFLMYLLTLFNGNFTNNEFGQISLTSDRAGRAVTKLVTNANVIGGRFTYSSNDLENRYSLVNVTYNNPNRLGDTDTATDYEDSLITRYGLQAADLVLAGCYSEAMAVRKARWAIWTNAYDTEFISFSNMLAGMDYRVGELVKILDNKNSGFDHQGRILSSSDNGLNTTLVLDRPIALGPESYTVTFLDADGVTVNTKTLLQSNATVSAISFVGLAAPSEKTVFIIESATKKPITARVVSVKKDGDYYNVSCVKHTEAKYAYIDGSIALPPPSTDFINLANFGVSAPVNVAVSEVFGSDGVTHTSKLQIHWDWNLSGTETIRPAYQVLWRRDNQAYRTVKDIKIKELDIENPVPGQYEIIVFAINPISNMKSAGSASYVYNYRNVAAGSSLDPVLVVVVQGTNGLIFDTADLNLSIQHNPANDTKVDKLRDYICEVWTADGMTLKGTFTVPYDANKNGLFTLPLSNNFSLFGVATRQFQIKVYCRDLTGRLSSAKAVVVNNPPPGVVTFDLLSGIGIAYVDITPPADNDVIGYIIYRDTTAGFTPGPATQVYDGPDTYSSIASGNGITYYYRVAAYDSFGKDALNISGEQNSTTLSWDVDTWTFDGLTFKPNDPSTNYVSWTAGYGHKTSNGVTTTYPIAAGNAAWTSGILYIYYKAGDATISATTTLGIAVSGSSRILATYAGGTDLTVGNGNAFFSGDKILAGTVGANQLVTSTAVITGAAQIAAALITNSHLVDSTIDFAKIANTIKSTAYNPGVAGWFMDKFGNAELNSAVFRGTVDVKSGTSGARTEITNSTVRVYDASGVLRVKLGNLA